MSTGRRSTAGAAPPLRARRLGIDTQHEAVIFMRKDCHVCRSEGFGAHARVLVRHGGRETIATLYQVSADLLADGEAGLSEATWQRLQLEHDGTELHVSHPAPVGSMSAVRGKIYGLRLGSSNLAAIMQDVAAGRYSDIQLSAFVTACSAQPLDREETMALTGAMIDAGDRIHWEHATIADKHCVGGLPGNRTTPIVVAIVVACGATMPKTSSRAITSPAGTADTMETLTRVDLNLPEMRHVVEREGGCIVWGGAVRLSPVDDLLIRIERALDLDSEGQLVASVLSKKVAAGATHVVLDLPVGPTAKIRDCEAARAMSKRLSAVGSAFGLTTRTIVSDGMQPVGRGIGPALEARDVLAVLQGQPAAPDDLRERALALAAALLEMIGLAPAGLGHARATAALADGRAWSKFQAICEAQGGMRLPPVAQHREPVLALEVGIVRAIDNRRVAKTAKLAGAPDAKASGIELHARLGDHVAAGQPLYTIHAETRGELDYALDYALANRGSFTISHDG